MFSIVKKLFGRFTEISIYDEEGESCVSIIPECGAAIHRLELMKNKKGRTILRSFDNPEEFQKAYLDYFSGALLFPFPNRLAGGKFQLEGSEYTFNCNDPELPNALHGFVHDKSFAFDETLSHEGVIVLTYNYNGDNASFPFPFTLSVKYKLEKNTLHITNSIRNEGNQNLPCGLGWHPYFAIDGDIASAQLMIPSEKMIEVDENMIPTGRINRYDKFINYEKIGKTQLDHCFIVAEDLNETKLKIDDDEIVLNLGSGQGKYNYVQYFTPPDRRSIAIEPMTCPPDALNSGEGIIVLEPGSEKVFSFSISLT